MAKTLMRNSFNVTFICILPVFFRFWWAVTSYGRIPVEVRFLQKLWQWGRLRMEKSCTRAESCTMVLWPLARWAYFVTTISGPKLNHQVSTFCGTCVNFNLYSHTNRGRDIRLLEDALKLFSSQQCLQGFWDSHFQNKLVSFLLNTHKKKKQLSLPEYDYVFWSLLDHLQVNIYL